LFPLSRRILVFGAGGGGDIVTAAAFALKLRRLGYRTYISAAPWERLVIDPVPGPIHLSEVREPSLKEDGFIAVNKDSYAVRRGRKLVFQAVNVAKAISEDIYLCDMNKGVKGVAEALVRLSRYLDVDLVVGLDVGGDILALGYEESLWSPLADQVSLSALHLLTVKHGIDTVIALASPGADGELDRDYVLRRINEVFKEGGYKGAIGFGPEDLAIFKKITEYAVTEAGKVILDALTGYVGWKSIRNGTRSVYIDALSTLVFLLDTGVLFRQSEMAQRIIDTGSLDEANEILMSLGIATEYELELEARKLLKDGETPSRETLIQARKNILEKARKKRLKDKGGRAV